MRYYGILNADFQIAKGFLPMMSMPGSGINADDIPEDAEQRLDTNQILSTYGKDVPRLPCCLVMCGSGCVSEAGQQDISSSS